MSQILIPVLTPFLMPIAGGILIGLSASVLLLFIGRIAGVSGIVWGAVFARFDSNISNVLQEKLWRWLFILGLLLGAWMFHQVSDMAYPQVDADFMLASIAGLLVGIGVKVGNGCTSGHGVCGIGRFSIRSLTATICFMVVAIFTVFLFNLVVSS